MKLLKRIVLGLVLGVCGLLLIAFGFRAFAQHHFASQRQIRTPNGIQESSYVVIGGIPQWIEIRGEDRRNPVMLFLHGGPGASTIPLSSSWQPWEKYFTVVQWEQRGTGRTLRATGRAVAPTMTIERFVTDGIELAEYLRGHLHASKILLVGHSWGSLLGYEIAMRRPDLFSAYIGTGQLLGGVNGRYAFDFRYPKLLAAATARHDERALAELEALKRSPRFAEVIRLSKQLGVPFDRPGNFRIPPPLMPEYSAVDWFYLFYGSALSLQEIEPQLRDHNLASLGSSFPIPIFFFEGSNDGVTPMAPVESFCRDLAAPHKELVRFEGANHFVIYSRADEFLTQLRQRVLPIIQTDK